MANAIVKIYKRQVNYQVYKNSYIDEDKLTLKSKQLKNEHNNIHKSNIYHSKNVNNIRFDSIKRAKQKIIDIALLNDFDYFVTFTFNDKIVNAYDYQVSMKKLKKWLENMVQRNDLIYLLVPELHKSGRIHFHALMSGDFNLEDSGHKDKSNRKIYNLLNWKYGFTTCVKIDGCYDAVCKYILKYVTKDINKITGNFYYSGGHGLLRLPDKMYADIDYDSFDGREYFIPVIFDKVKYSMRNIKK